MIGAVTGFRPYTTNVNFGNAASKAGDLAVEVVKIGQEVKPKKPFVSKLPPPLSSEERERRLASGEIVRLNVESYKGYHKVG